MNRIAAIALTVFCILSLVSCGSGDKPASAGFSSASLVIEYDGNAYGVNEKVDGLKKVLGEPADTVSQASCHYPENGDEYWFDYYFGDGTYAPENEDYTDVLRIHTVPLKPEEDYICDIECYTDKVTTEKGLTVGAAWEEVTKAYGDGYTNEGDGYYTYYDGEALPDTPRLMFHIVDDKVEFFAVSAAINI